MELEVEQTTEGEPADVEQPAEVYGCPIPAIAEEDHTAGL
jgi:hypothetical protein